MREQMTTIEGDAILDRLLARCGSGDLDAAAELFDRTWAPMLQVARCAAHSEQRAQDAVAEAYLQVWARCLRGEGLGPHPSLRLLALAHTAATTPPHHTRLIA